MTDYQPLYKPGQSITRQASADVTGGQLVEVTGDGTVAATGAASAKFVGVAGFDAKSGENVTVSKGGVQRIVTAGAVTAGDILVSAAAGKVVTNAAPAAGQQVGIALSTAASGAVVDVDMTR